MKIILEYNDRFLKLSRGIINEDLLWTSNQNIRKTVCTEQSQPHDCIENAEMSSNPYLNMTVREFFEARSKEIASVWMLTPRIKNPCASLSIETSNWRSTQRSWPSNYKMTWRNPRKRRYLHSWTTRMPPKVCLWRESGHVWIESQMVLRIKAIEGPHKGAVFIVKPQKV